MKYFSNFSDPDLKLTLDALEIHNQVCFRQITDLDKTSASEKPIQDVADKMARARELMDAIENEMFNRKQG